MCLGFLFNGSNFQGWGFNPKYQKHKNEMYKWNVKLDFLKIYWVPENWYSYFNGFSESCYTATTTAITKNHKKNHKSNKLLWKFIPYTFFDMTYHFYWHHLTPLEDFIVPALHPNAIRNNRRVSSKILSNHAKLEIRRARIFTIYQTECRLLWL